MRASAKLLFVHTESELGGAERVVLNLLSQESVRERSLLVVAACREGPLADEARSLGARVKTVAGARLRSPMGVLRVIEQVAEIGRRAGATAVCAKGAHPQVFGSLTARLLGVPSIFIASMIYEPDPRRSNPIDNLALHGKLDFAFANSIACARTLAQIRPDVPQRVLPLGTALRVADDDEVRELRRALGLDGRRVVGVFGRLQRWKGQDVFVDAALRITQARDEVTFLVVGAASFDLEPEFAKGLRLQVAAAGREDRVRFLGFRDDVPALMRLCDLVCHTSREPEPFGMVIIEALAQGRAVIATQGGGPSEILAGGCGRLIAADDPARLAHEICELLDDDEERGRIAAAGRARVESRYSASAMARAFLGGVAEVTA